jgi:hypothetical protein
VLLGEPLAQRGQVISGVDVKQQRRSPVNLAGDPAAVGKFAVSLTAVLSKAWLQHRWWPQQQAVGARTVAVGDDHNRRIAVV